MTLSGEPRDLPLLDRAPPVADLTLDDNGVTFLIVSAGGPLRYVLRRLAAELATGRRVHVVATPRAAAWLDHYELGPVVEDLTGWPIRSRLDPPTVPTFQPPGSSVVASPCTLNTLTKWAAGHSDNLAISLLCEAVGRGVPTRAEVSLSGPYAAHPGGHDALDRLASLGVELYRAHGTTEPDHLPPLPAELAHQLGGGEHSSGAPT